MQNQRGSRPSDGLAQLGSMISETSMPQIRKLKPGSDNWLKSLKETVMGECPPLVECKKCGRIIREGYVCFHCGCDDPGNNEIRPEEWM